MPRSSTPITGDAQQVKLLIAWLRERKIDATVVTVGVCSVTLAAAKPVVSTAPPAQVRGHREPIYARFGGDAFKSVQDGDGFGELQPVVARR